MITIYDVDIASRDKLDGIVVQVIPDSIANDPTTDPTVVDGERCDSPQQPHQKRLFLHEARHILNGSHLTTVTVARRFKRSASRHELPSRMRQPHGRCTQITADLLQQDISAALGQSGLILKLGNIEFSQSFSTRGVTIA